MRYRLRFSLQEFDLDTDEIVIGRGSNCTVTVDDPMISRRHVKIDVGGPQPTVEDLGSQNGTLLNGSPLPGVAVLRDGDRIRLGTQELVFLIMRPDRRAQRTTGSLTVCDGCAIPYPSASSQCPHCGSVPTDEGEDTAVRDVAASGWTFHLLSEVVDRAIDQGRLADAERMMSRGVEELEQQLNEGVDVDAERVFGVAECAVRLGCALRSAWWLHSGAQLYDRLGQSPTREVLALLDKMPSEPQLEEALVAVRRAAASGADATGDVAS